MARNLILYVHPKVSPFTAKVANMALTFVRAKDVAQEDLHMKLLFYGDSGAGKTWLASGADKCAILLTERNGEQSIRNANPDALYVFVTTAAEVRDFLRAAMDGTLREQGIETLVIDGLTEIQQMFKDDIVAGRGDGEFSIRDWGTLHEKMRGLLRMLRDLPYNVVCTALSSTDTAEEIHYVKPQFQGRNFSDEVMQYFNAVGYVFKRGATSRGGLRGKSVQKSAVQHVVMFDGPARIKCKNCHPLRGVLPGSSQFFLDVLRGEVKLDTDDDDVTVPDEAPAEADDTKAAEPAEKPEAADPAPTEPKPEKTPARRRRRSMGT